MLQRQPKPKLTLHHTAWKYNLVADFSKMSGRVYIPGIDAMLHLLSLYSLLAGASERHQSGGAFFYSGSKGAASQQHAKVTGPITR